MAKFDLEAIKGRAAGQWPAIVSRVAGISDDYLTTQHGPCPKCGGTKPWRVFNDFAETGGAVCNHCGKFGDGLALIQWALDCSFPVALQKVGEFLGVEPAKAPRKKQSPDPSSHLEDLPWNDGLVNLWCLKKKPITPDAIRAVGGRLARYKNRYTVLAIPLNGSKPGSTVGWCLYEIGGGKLPVFRGKGQQPEMVKVKITTGSKSGWVQ